MWGNDWGKKMESTVMAYGIFEREYVMEKEMNLQENIRVFKQIVRTAKVTKNKQPGFKDRNSYVFNGD